jgi:hypothetical protein
MLLQKADQRLKLLSGVAELMEDNRREASCKHSLLNMLRQRVYGIALGYEDLNDHDTLKNDLALQTAVGNENKLASRPTLSRFENSANRDVALKIHEVLFEQFVSSFESAPEELILDFDATDDLVHGNQEGAFYNGYYENTCFLPLYVTCGEHLLVAYLRKSNQDAAKHTWAILSLLVRALRNRWPGVKILFRADGGFCRHRIFSWCERNKVSYVTGIGGNSRLLSLAEPLISQASQYFQHTCEKQRVFGEVLYRAKTWDRDRRVIIKAEHLEKGPNPRFVVTNLEGDPQHIYEHDYCARGDMENRIKEQQLDMYADRTSCHAWWSNQFRLLLSSLAYVLVNAIRRIALTGTQLASAQVGTIRLKLFKIGALILRNTRRIRFLLSSSYPYQELFLAALSRLALK